MTRRLQPAKAEGPKALDLFCGAGGASRGLADAGFKVCGSDILEQPNYPYPFERRNALSYTVAELRRYDLIWASPPCQAFTAYKRRPGHVRPRRNWIPATRRLLKAAGVPYIIENVEGAPLQNAVTLCGSMFGLDVRRHRLFECSFPVDAPPCRHDLQKTPKYPPAGNRTNLRCTCEIGVWRIPLDVQRRAIGIDWMELHELTLAVPPAYSKYLADYAACTTQP